MIVVHVVLLHPTTLHVLDLPPSPFTWCSCIRTEMLASTTNTVYPNHPRTTNRTHTHGHSPPSGNARPNAVVGSKLERLLATVAPRWNKLITDYAIAQPNRPILSNADKILVHQNGLKDRGENAQQLAEQMVHRPEPFNANRLLPMGNYSFNYPLGFELILKIIKSITFLVPLPLSPTPCVWRK